MNAIYTVVYGTRAEADRAAARVRAIHASVQGSIPERRGSYPAGTRYAARDPQLLLWVHGTLSGGRLAGGAGGKMKTWDAGSKEA